MTAPGGESARRLITTAVPLPPWQKKLQNVGGRLRWAAKTAAMPRVLGEGTCLLGPRSTLRVLGDGRLDVGRNVVFRGDLYLYTQGTCSIGDDTFVNRWCYISAFSDVRIGRRVRLGERVSIHDENHLDAASNDYDTRPVWIGDEVWIGAGATILAGASIGEGAIIAAGAVVTGQVPPRSVAAGVPARVIKSLPPTS